MKRLIVLIALIIFLATNNPVTKTFADDEYETYSFQDVPAFSFGNGGRKLPILDATAAIAMDFKSGRVLFDKNAKIRKPIASTTKIMTAIIAIENGNLNDEVIVSKRSAGIGGSTIKLKVGEKLSLEEMLYGLMLNSGNDAAIAIAEHIGGSVEGFVDMMNKKALDLELVDTSYRSPHGLDADAHYSTAYDLAMLTRYALANSTFAKIVKTPEKYINGRNLRNTNELLRTCEGVEGVKTGYTGKAGRCLVAAAKVKDLRVISVVLNCPTSPKRTQSSKNLLDYAFTNYKPYTFIKENEFLKYIDVEKGNMKNVPLEAMNEIAMPLTDIEKANVEMQVDLPYELKAPVYRDIEVGEIRYILNGNVIASTKVKTSSTVLHKSMWDYINLIVKSWRNIVRGVDISFLYNKMIG